MKSRWKKGCVLVFLLSMFSAMTVSAQEMTKPIEATGSITIQLEDTEPKKPKDHVVFHVTKIADVKDGRYEMKADYEKSDVDLNLLETANDVEEACKKLEPFVKKEMEMVTNEVGEAVLKELPVGVYFIRAADMAKYEKMTSFLVSIPNWNEADKVMEYNVTAIPKHTEEIKTNPPKLTNPPKTGDESEALFWITIVVGALGVAGILLVIYSCIRVGAMEEEQIEKLYKELEEEQKHE